MKTIYNTPTDEQIAEYISGTANERDSLIVKRYLEENNEAVDDMLNIAIASIVQKKRSTSQKKSKILSLYTTRWAVAASIAIVLITGGILMLRNPTSNPTIIASTDSKNETSGHTNDITSGAEKDIDATVPTVHRQSATNGTTVQREEHITASESTSKTHSTTIIYPRRKHEAVPGGTDITFRWQSDASSLTLTILDDKGVELVKTSIPCNGSYTVPAQKIENTDEISWTISVANVAEQYGTIAIVRD